MLSATLWARRERLLEALDRLPQVLCHHDAFRRNLFLRSGRLLAVDEIVSLWADFAVWQARLAAEALTTAPRAP